MELPRGEGRCMLLPYWQLLSIMSMDLCLTKLFRSHDFEVFGTSDMKNTPFLCGMYFYYKFIIEIPLVKGREPTLFPPSFKLITSYLFSPCLRLCHTIIIPLFIYDPIMELPWPGEFYAPFGLVNIVKQPLSLLWVKCLVSFFSLSFSLPHHHPSTFISGHGKDLCPLLKLICLPHP